MEEVGPVEVVNSPENLTKKRKRDENEDNSRASIEQGLLDAVGELEVEVGSEKKRMLNEAVILMEKQHGEYRSELKIQEDKIKELNGLIAEFQANANTPVPTENEELASLRTEKAQYQAEKEQMVSKQILNSDLLLFYSLSCYLDYYYYYYICIYSLLCHIQQ